MSTPRGHHIVAQFYLRAFARGQGTRAQVEVYDKKTGRWSIRNVRDAFKQRDWNTVLMPDGTPNVEYEELLARNFDAPAADAFRRLRDDDFMVLEQLMEPVAYWMAAQLSRGRFAKQNLREFMSEVNLLRFRLAAQSMDDEAWKRAYGLAPSPELRERLVSGDPSVELDISNFRLLHTLLSSVDEFARLLAIRSWTLLCFEQPCLITGEDPVLFVTPRGDDIGHSLMGAQWMYLPVSPTRALVLRQGWTRPHPPVSAGTPEDAAQLNWAFMTDGRNQELLRHPDVPAHPLPDAARLARTQGRWPWPAERDSEPPLWLGYYADRRSESTRRPVGGSRRAAAKPS